MANQLKRNCFRTYLRQFTRYSPTKLPFIPRRHCRHSLTTCCSHFLGSCIINKPWRHLQERRPVSCERADRFFCESVDRLTGSQICHPLNNSVTPLTDLLPPQQTTLITRANLFPPWQNCQPKYGPIEYKICDVIAHLKKQGMAQEWSVAQLEQNILQAVGRIGPFDTTFDHCGYTVNGL